MNICVGLQDVAKCILSQQIIYHPPSPPPVVYLGPPLITRTPPPLLTSSPWRRMFTSSTCTYTRWSGANSAGHQAATNHRPPPVLYRPTYIRKSL